jgi:hypothetical protein
VILAQSIVKESGAGQAIALQVFYRRHTSSAVTSTAVHLQWDVNRAASLSDLAILMIFDLRICHLENLG